MDNNNNNNNNINNQIPRSPRRNLLIDDVDDFENIPDHVLRHFGQDPLPVAVPNNREDAIDGRVVGETPLRITRDLDTIAFDLMPPQFMRHTEVNRRQRPVDALPQRPLEPQINVINLGEGDPRFHVATLLTEEQRGNEHLQNAIPLMTRLPESELLAIPQATVRPITTRTEQGVVRIQALARGNIVRHNKIRHTGRITI